MSVILTDLNKFYTVQTTDEFYVVRRSTSSLDAINTVSCASMPHHFWDPCIFCRRTNSLEFTAWSSARSSCWLRTI